MRNGAGAGAALGHPLVRTGRALRELPFEAEQVLEEVVAPLRRRGGPRAFQAAGDRVVADAGAERVAPAEALLLERRALRLRPDVLVRIGESSAGPGMVPSPAPSLATHWCAPAGLLLSSHS